MVVVKGKCDCCGKTNNECVVVEKRIFWFFVVEVFTCQSCVSRSFKLFTKNV